jgi:putative addiction module killer protein
VLPTSAAKNFLDEDVFYGIQLIMIEIRQTELYSEWFSDLRDRAAKARIDIRIRRLSLGNPGDVKAVGDGVSELRIDYGPGYRLYFAQRGLNLILLLAGGNKSTQEKDIKTAKEIVRKL